MIKYLALLVAITTLAGEPDDGQTNHHPQKLQAMSPPLVQRTTNAPTIPSDQVKEPAIILRNILVRSFNGRIIMIVPERYMADLTNIYQFQLVPKIYLEEP